MLDRLGVILFGLAFALPAFGQPVTPSLPPSAPDAETLFRQAHALRDAGRPAEAETLLRQAAALRPDDPAVAAELTEAVADQGREPEALRLAEHALALDPRNPDLRLRLADFYLAADRQDSALEQYRLVLKDRPNDPALKRRVADILVAMDRTQEAIPFLEAYLAAVPRDEAALKMLYQCFLWTGQEDLALVTLEKRVRMRPDDLECVAELAERYLDRGREKEAIEQYRRVVANRPDDLAARKALGQLYEWNDAPEEALEQYEAYLKLRPLDADVRARCLALSTDLGYGRRALGHVRLLGLGDPAYRQTEAELRMQDTGLGTSIELLYALYQNSRALTFHQAGPKFTYAVTDRLSVGGYYRFLHFKGPTPATTSETLMGHEAGALAELGFASGLAGSARLGVAGYHDGAVSFNGRLEVSGDLGPVGLTAMLLREDIRSTLGAVKARIVSNGVGVRLYSEPWWRLFVTAGGEYDRYSDANNRGEADVEVGVTAVTIPRLDVAYHYAIEAFGTTKDSRVYFAPSHFQTHGPLASFRHPVTPWFLYGLDLRLAHSIEENLLLLTYGARVTLRPGVRHLIGAAYLRTDSLNGRSSQLYREHVLTGTYSFEF
jgi:tetratricopeptide (TPR) repeat protein